MKLYKQISKAIFIIVIGISILLYTNQVYGAGAHDSDPNKDLSGNSPQGDGNYGAVWEDESTANQILQEQQNVIDKNDSYHGTEGLGNSNAGASHTPDEIIGDAQDFLNKAGNSTTINGGNLKRASSTLYNILLSIGMFTAVAIGIYLGVKFMMSSVEDKAKVKEALIPYIAGCTVIFSAFVIWRLVILLLGNIA